MIYCCQRKASGPTGTEKRKERTMAQQLMIEATLFHTISSSNAEPATAELWKSLFDGDCLTVNEQAKMWVPGTTEFMGMIVLPMDGVSSVCFGKNENAAREFQAKAGAGTVHEDWGWHWDSNS